jgi:hypothetical protein
MFGVLATDGAVARAADEMSVQVKTTQVRDKGSYLGKPLYELRFGDRVTVLQKGSAWFKIQPVNTAAVKMLAGAQSPPGGYAGYLNKSALTTKRIVLKGDQSAQMAASSEEVALAGKGFNDEVEKSYKTEHPNLVSAYATLDQIEANAAYSPSAEDVSEFRTAGGLGGGAQ